MRKKSQLELFGLIIIVVFLSLGLLLVVSYMLKPKAETRQSYVEVELASNTLSAMLKSVATDCNNQDLTTLLQDCANSGGVVGSFTCDTLEDSCTYVNKTIGDIINKTLWEWRYSYRFVAYRTPSSNMLFFDNKDCNANKDREKPAIFHLPLDYGVLTVRLDICKS